MIQPHPRCRPSTSTACRADAARVAALVLDLPAESATRVAYHRYREATLTVDEADDPLLGPWSFLLIVRTVRVFTAHVAHGTGRTYDTNEYRRILGVSSI